MQLDDFNWFLKNYNDFYTMYGICYIVIKQKTILGTYNDLGTAIKETLKSEPIGSFIVQLCNGDKSGYTNYIASSEICVI